MKRRHRARRVVAALLVAVAALAVVGHFTAAGARVPVLVASRDLAAGQRLTAADLRTVAWPAATGLPTLTTTAAVGQVLNGPLHTGDPVTVSRLRSARQWPAGSNRVVLSIALDPALARVVDAGDRMDVYGGGQLLTSGAIVSGGIKTSSPEWAGSSDGPRVLLAVTATDAPAVSGALQDQAGTTVSLALHPAA